MNAWKHFKKICIHKYWVGYYCFKCGLYWQGITHDMSKFSPTEFLESVKYYQGTRSPIEACKEKNGYSMAWFHHRGRNLHHYECWVDNFDKYYSREELTLVEMPFKYALEMLCDYLGAARAYLGKAFSYKKEWKWWLNKRTNCAMNPHTKAFMDACLYKLASNENDEFLSDIPFLQALYHARNTSLAEDDL